MEGPTNASLEQVELLSRDEFLAIAKKYGDTETIDRINNDPTYEPWCIRRPPGKNIVNVLQEKLSRMPLTACSLCHGFRLCYRKGDPLVLNPDRNRPMKV